MPEGNVLHVSERATKGSAEARRLRRTGMVPVVLYGGSKSAETLLQIDEVEFMKKVKDYSTGVVTLVDPKGRKSSAIIKEIQWDHLVDRPIHVDFYRVSLDQVVHVRVPLHLQGTARGAVFGGVIDQLVHELPIKVKASGIPHEILLDIASLGIGDSMHVSDLTLPEGVICELPVEQTVVHVAPPTVEKVKAAAETEEEAEEKPAEEAE